MLSDRSESHSFTENGTEPSVSFQENILRRRHRKEARRIDSILLSDLNIPLLVLGSFGYCHSQHPKDRKAGR